MLIEANAHTGRREKGRVRSNDSEFFGSYGRDRLNENGELLLSFVNNHGLALMNTVFGTLKGGESHIFNGRGKKRIDNILTKRSDHKLVRIVAVHPPSTFLPISDHHNVSAPVNLIGHFSQAPPLRTSPKPPVDRRRLVTDPQLRQEVATAVERNLRTNPPGGSIMNDVAAAFAAAIGRTAEWVIPPQERRRPARDWSGDAQTEDDL